MTAIWFAYAWLICGGLGAFLSYILDHRRKTNDLVNDFLFGPIWLLFALLELSWQACEKIDRRRGL
jgi:hypothetical protein